MSSSNRKSQFIALLYLVPGFTVYSLFTLWPIAMSIKLSMFSWNGLAEKQFVGFDNFIAIFGTQTFLRSFSVALILVPFYAIIPVALALFIVHSYRRTRSPLMPTYRVLVFLPQAMPTVAIVVPWLWIYSLNGPINGVLSVVGMRGIRRAWIGEFGTALPAIGVIASWMTLGFALVVMMSGINRIAVEYYEGVRVDGGNRLHELIHVTIPGLRQELAVLISINTVSALRSFDLVYMTTRGGPGTATLVPGIVIYRLAFQRGEFGTAAAMATLFSLFATVTAIVIWRAWSRGL